MPSRLRIVMARAALAALAAATALLLAEVAVRVLAPVEELFPRWQWETVPADSQATYVTDTDLGYRPVLGVGEYSEFGTVVNEHPVAKRDGVTRLLFLGDSVTHRWRIQRSLEQRCRESPVEFWNAGVEGFNTGQEVEYYLRWNHRIAPDHVTLVFHNNDFVATPVVFRDDAGEVVVANPRAYLTRTDVALARSSHLYRHYLRGRIALLLRDDPITSADETRAALERLKSALAASDVGFDVILVPVFKPPGDWTAYEKRSREISLEILDELEIPFYDLIEPLENSVREGLELTESPGDVWHPSDQLARRLARHLRRRGYLESIFGPQACRPAPRPGRRPAR